MKAKVISRSVIKLSIILVKPFTHPTITRETLGQHTWAMLHTMSVYYPEKPTNDETLKMDLFLKML